MDTLTPNERSKRMGLIGRADTKPEKTVRSIVHKLGYRYRLHGKYLPGRPDLVFHQRKKVIFVHGCFWHQHPDPRCPLSRLPKSRLDFWKPKLVGNHERDIRSNDKLQELGWDVLEVWECQLRDRDALTQRLGEFLECA